MKTKHAALIATLLLNTYLLTGCSFAMKGKIFDIVTGNGIAKAKVSIKLNDDKTRDEEANDEGSYRIKKDDKDQEVTYTADNYESFTTTIKKDKTKDVYLVPTPEETARRIVQAMIDKDYSTAYLYLHPNYKGILTEEKFRQENEGEFASYLELVKEFRIAEVRDLESYRDESMKKTYEGVKSITAVLVMDLEGKVENTWEIILFRVKDADGKDYWHWLFNRTSNT
ncbi:MAG TPA: hypothetical protein PKL83_06270 [bacterium]|nr:hypothetical protein [bacterium]